MIKNADLSVIQTERERERVVVLKSTALTQTHLTSLTTLLFKVSQTLSTHRVQTSLVPHYLGSISF